MIAHVLQPWTTLCILNGQDAIQTQDQWLSLDGFRDISAWVHVAHASLSLDVHLQTSPTDDASAFTTTPATRTTVTGPGVFFALNRASQGSNPLGPSTTQLMRVLRWRIAPNGAGDYSLTFRIVVCLNPVVADFRITRGEGEETFTNPALGAR